MKSHDKADSKSELREANRRANAIIAQQADELKGLSDRLGDAERIVRELVDYRGVTPELIDRAKFAELTRLYEAEKARAERAESVERDVTEGRHVYLQYEIDEVAQRALSAEDRLNRTLDAFKRYVQWHGSCLNCHPDDADPVVDAEAIELDRQVNAVLGESPDDWTPTVNIRCETESDGIAGSTTLNVIRVEREDDGSYTAVTDHWPR